MSNKNFKHLVPAGFSWNDESNYLWLNGKGQCWNDESNYLWLNDKGQCWNLDDTGEISVLAGIVDVLVPVKEAAPRVTAADVDAAIINDAYSVHGTLTICVLTLKNGFQVTGESACVSSANFDAQKGRDLARTDAKNKIWPLLGYALRDQIAAQERI